MWIIFEGLDKSGKTTLMREFAKATQYTHILIDRGPAGYITYDVLFKRHTSNREANFLQQAKHITQNNTIVIYCYANEEVTNRRLQQHNEKQIEVNKTFEQMQDMYTQNVFKCYGMDSVMTLNTSYHSIESCVARIIKAINDVDIVEF